MENFIHALFIGIDNTTASVMPINGIVAVYKSITIYSTTGILITYY